MQSARRISLILAGVTDVLRRNTGRREDRLFKFAVEMQLKPLAEIDARRLIQEPVRGRYQLTTSAVDRIVIETNRQPYLIQQVCLKLYEQMSHRRATLATDADVETVFDSEIVPYASHFGHLREPIQEPAFYVIIKCLAALQTGRRYVSLSDLQRQLRRSGAELGADEIRARLREIIEERTQTVIDRAVARADHYRISVGLFARHLRYLQEDRYHFLLRQ